MEEIPQTASPTTQPAIAERWVREHATPAIAGRLARLTADEAAPELPELPDPIEAAERAVRRQAAHAAKRTVRSRARLPSSAGRRREIERKRARDQAKDSRYLERLAARMDLAGQNQPKSEIELIPGRVWTMAMVVLSDPTGQAAKIYLARQRNRVAVGAIREAALVPGPAGCRYTWADWRARAITALGLALLMMCHRTARRGIWASMVKGLTIGAFGALLRNPWDRTARPSRTAISGVHRAGGSYREGTVGYLTALRQAGFCYSQQLPASDVTPAERWVTRRGDIRASNRYWIVTASPSMASTDEIRARLLELHERGWLAPDEQIERAPERYTAASTPSFAAPDG